MFCYRNSALIISYEADKSLLNLMFPHSNTSEQRTWTIRIIWLLVLFTTPNSMIVSDDIK